MKIPTHKELLEDVEAYLKKKGMLAHVFGQTFLSDSGALSRLKKGADPRLSKVIKIYNIIQPARKQKEQKEQKKL